MTWLRLQREPRGVTLFARGCTSLFLQNEATVYMVAICNRSPSTEPELRCDGQVAWAQVWWVGGMCPGEVGRWNVCGQYQISDGTHPQAATPELTHLPPSSYTIRLTLKAFEVMALGLDYQQEKTK